MDEWEVVKRVNPKKERHIVSVAMDGVEYRKLFQAARARDMALSAYIREAALHSTEPIILWSDRSETTNSAIGAAVLGEK